MTKQILSGKSKGKKKLEQAFEGNSLLLLDITLPEQLTERMIMKEQKNRLIWFSTEATSDTVGCIASPCEKG